MNAALALMAAQLLVSHPVPLAASLSPMGYPGQDAPSLVVQLGYTQAVSAVAVSPDGTLAVAGSFYGTTRLWHLPTGSELRRFDGHTAGVIAAAFSPDGRQVLTGSHDGTARLWDAATGVEIFRFQEELEAPRPSVAFSADGRVLLVGALGGPARLFDRETGEEILSVQPSVVGAPFAALSPDGLRLVTASMTPGMQIWDTRTGELQVTFGSEAPPLVLPGALAFSGDGTRVLAGHADGAVRVWAPETGEIMRTLPGHAGGVSGLSLSADGSLLLTTSNVDGRAVLWDMESAVERQEFGGGGGHLWAAELSQDGGSVLGGSVIAVTLFEAESGSVERRLEGFSHGIQSVSFSHDGLRILVSDLAFGVHFWNLEAGARDARLTGMFSAFAEQAGLAVIVDPGGAQAEIWDATADTLLRRFPIDEGPLIALAVAPDGGRIATKGVGDSDISVWDTRTGASLGTLVTIGDETIQTLTFLPGGDRLVAGGDGVRVWDVETGTSSTRLEGVVALDVDAFPDGRRVLICAGELVRVLELETGAVQVLVGHTDFVNAVAVSPDGRYAASGGRDRTVRVWDVATGEAIHVMRGHDDAITDLAFSPDGAHLLTGSRDGTARLWDVGTGVELASLVAFSDGSWVAVAPDGRFDADELEEIRGVHWVMPDAPFEPLPIEIFMRDYYEPRLVGRLLEREEMVPVRDLSAVNRVQPEVVLVAVETDAGGGVSVTLRVSEGERYQRVGTDSTRVRSGAHDLRLFRDGQLVGWRDGALDLTPDGTATVRFDGIRLPRRGGVSSVSFSAYAFNDDRVKSPTARTVMELPADAAPTRGRAYVITIGVDAYESPAWDLRFAANDAWLLSRDLAARLAESSSFEDVVAVPLVSAHDPGESTVATKASIRGVLELLAGGEMSAELRSLIPGAERIRAATPDDLVFLSFSTHGYRDPAGTFYLLPADIGSDAQKRVTPELLERAISSDELTEWLRGIDAGEIVLVVDACHSAAAVEGVGFKPGPMGSRGLGQLAYDKGMRVLAASQAEDVALESDLIRQGLLTYALVRDGLEARQADRRPSDGIITLSEWLEYGVDRVPALYREVQEGEIQTFGLAGRSIEIGGSRQDPDFQQPSLFDFRRGGMELSLVRN